MSGNGASKDSSEPGIILYGRGLVGKHPEDGYRTAISEALCGGCRIVSHDGGQKSLGFQAACLAWATDNGFIRLEGIERGGAFNALSFGLTAKGCLEFSPD